MIRLHCIHAAPIAVDSGSFLMRSVDSRSLLVISVDSCGLLLTLVHLCSLRTFSCLTFYFHAAIHTAA